MGPRYVGLFSQIQGTRVGGLSLSMRALVAWRGGLFMTEGEIGVLSVFSSIFNAGGSVCGCRSVYTHAHKHTAHMGYSDVSPGVGVRHL